MIRVNRPITEPSPLTAERANALAKFGPTGPKDRAELGAGYKKAHQALWSSQHYKCAYCEAREQSKRNDVEHFRPAMRADRSPGSTATYGYWWLAFTWENLLFSCRNCNQSPAKLDKFPLDSGSVPLVPHEAPPGQERPLLIDPADPLAPSGTSEIEFIVETRQNSKPRWIPRARNGSVRGDWTIRVCKLDRPDLVTLYTQHVDVTLAPERQRMAGALATGDAATIQSAWQTYVNRHVAPSAVFAGLAIDVLCLDVPSASRQAFALTLPPL